MSDFEEDTGRRDKPGPYDVNDAIKRDCRSCQAEAGERCHFPGAKVHKAFPCIARLKASTEESPR